jgi:Outer membrane lipoprotein-sorting protein
MPRFALAVAAWIALVAPIARAAPPSAGELEQCMRRNLPDRMRQEVQIESSDTAGAAQHIEATLDWTRTGDRSELCLAAAVPFEVRGSWLLVRRRAGARDFYFHHEPLRQTMHLTGGAVAGSLLGTGFRYEDLERAALADPFAATERLPDAEVDGRPVQVIGTTLPADSGSAYARVVAYVDRETCVALRTDLESKPGTLARRITAPFDMVQTVGDRWWPYVVAIEDAATGSRTQLTVRSLDDDPKDARSACASAPAPGR